MGCHQLGTGGTLLLCERNRRAEKEGWEEGGGEWREEGREGLKEVGRRRAEEGKEGVSCIVD